MNRHRDDENVELPATAGRMSSVDSPLASQTSSSALSLHEGIAARLLDRSVVSESHCIALETAIECPLQCAVVSTAEHAAPFNYSSTVSFLLPQLALAGPLPERRIVVLAASLVSMENSDHPRGIALPSTEESPRYVNSYPRSRYRNASLALVPPCTAFLAAEALRDFPWLFEALSTVPHVDYAAQLCTIMEAITARWLHGAAAGRVRVLPSESVAASLLADWIDADDETVAAVLFDAGVRRSIAERLRGVPCAWDEQRGTFLFWGADRDRARCVPLHEHDGELVGDGFRIALGAGTIAAALRQRRLLPGGFLSLFCLSWLTGVPVAGGRRQAAYWPAMISCLDEVLGGATSKGGLSVWGYDVCALEGLRVGEGASTWRLPSHGSGLALTSAAWGIEELLDALARLQWKAELVHS